MLRFIPIILVLGLFFADYAVCLEPGGVPLYQSRSWQNQLEPMRQYQRGSSPSSPSFRLPDSGRAFSSPRFSDSYPASRSTEPARPAAGFSVSPSAGIMAAPRSDLMITPGGWGDARRRSAFISSGRYVGFSKPPEGWQAIIDQASMLNNLDPVLLSAIIRAESGYNSNAVSSKGAMGAMQIMPATGKELGLKDFFNPKENIHAGARYLAELRRKFPHPELFLAAYNAGPGAVAKHGGIPPYAETKQFVSRVMNFWRPGVFSAPGKLKLSKKEQRDEQNGKQGAD